VPVNTVEVKSIGWFTQTGVVVDPALIVGRAFTVNPVEAVVEELHTLLLFSTDVNVIVCAPVLVRALEGMVKVPPGIVTVALPAPEPVTL
jgi:hypothetical protein